MPGSQSDTLRLTLAQAEELFQAQNLRLLAQKYQIGIAQAAEVQAKLWPNPTINLEYNLYNPVTGRVLETSDQSEFIVQAEQMILLAGKRKKLLALAMLNTTLTQYEFYELLRNLRYELRLAFVELLQEQQALQLYNQEINNLREVLALYEEQLKKNNVPLVEVTRLKALLFALDQDRFAMQQSLIAQSQTLKLLLRLPANVELIALADPKTQSGPTPDKIAELSFGKLLNQALEQRYDLRSAKLQADIAAANLSYQKALAVPDLHIGGVFDRAGNIGLNYAGIQFGIDLPFFNRNQGGIQAAEVQIKQAEVLGQQGLQVLETELQAAIQFVKASSLIYEEYSGTFSDDFDNMLLAVTQNYEKRNISLLQFVDYYETFLQAQRQLLMLRLRRDQALESLNYVTGQPVF